MKKKIDDPVVTKSMLNQRVEILESNIDQEINNLKNEMLGAFRGYRDEVLQRMDKDAGELEQIREDQLFIKHDITDLEKRVTSLEAAK